MRIDLHVHSNLSSCSELTLGQILSQAKHKNLNGVCITDHNTFAARHMISEGVQDDGLVVFIGMEYSTPGGDFLIFGPFAELQSGMSASGLLSFVKEMNGIAIAAHPCRNNRRLDVQLLKQGLCTIVEGINGRNQAEEDLHATMLASQYGVNIVGGSDAHNLAELGKVVTIFGRQIKNQFELIKALKEGDFSVDSKRHPELEPSAREQESAVQPE